VGQRLADQLGSMIAEQCEEPRTRAAIFRAGSIS
jgi:hypothetical protein